MVNKYIELIHNGMTSFKKKLCCLHRLTWSQQQLFYMYQVNVDLGSAHDTYSVKNVEVVWA